MVSPSCEELLSCCLNPLLLLCPSWAACARLHTHGNPERGQEMMFDTRATATKSSSALGRGPSVQLCPHQGGFGSQGQDPGSSCAQLSTGRTIFTFLFLESLYLLLQLSDPPVLEGQNNGLGQSWASPGPQQLQAQLAQPGLGQLLSPHPGQAKGLNHPTNTLMRLRLGLG